MASPMLFSDVSMHTSADKFFFESTHQDDKRRILIIDRVTRDISLEDNVGQIPAADIVSRQSIAGILGILCVGTGPAIVVATDRKKIGDVTRENHGLFQLCGAKTVSFARNDHHLTPSQQRENAALLAMVGQVLETPHFYFSYSADLTNTAQRKSNLGGDNDLVSLFTHWDARFVWNRSLLEPFLQKGAEFLPYCLVLIHGAAFVRQCSLNGKLFRYWLMSRRSVSRAGTRYFVRGCDDDGHCANFVETEQTVEVADAAASFVQTRGSIPLFWSQLPNVVEYKPDPVLERGKAHIDGYVRHFNEQLSIYGRQAIVNLIDQKKAEGMMEEHFRGVHQAASLPGVEYVAYDFHKECGANKWDKINHLVLDLMPTFHKFSYFLSSGHGLVKMQSGVFRTNCMDCLDRTNVVQSLLSSQFLQEALGAEGFKVLGEGQRVEDFAHFQHIFRGVWADHADLLSTQYAGTGAAKTDFTRTGKRTVRGMLSDLRNSIVRYYKNNFTFGFRQDAIDFFLGNYIVDANTIGRSAYARDTPTSWISYLPLLLLLSSAMFLLTLLFAPELDQGILLFLLFWLLFSVAVGKLLHINARELVDFPKFRKF